MPEPDSAPKVLVSYSHDSPEHMARVLALSDRLRAEGVESQVDQYETSPPEGWPRWTLNQIEWADFVLVVCTATYNRRFRGLEEKGKGRGVTWEGVILTQDLYDAAAHNTKFIPVVFDEEDAAHIPLMLRGATFYVLGAGEGYEALYRHLTNQPRTQKPGLGKLRPLPQRTHHATEDGHLWPVADPAAAFTPEPSHAEEEGDRTPSRRPAFRNARLFYLSAVLLAVAVAGLGVWWRYTSVPTRRGPVQLRGRVVAKNGGRVIREATVSVESDGLPASGRTDSDGVFSLRLSPSPDEVRVRIEAEGFNVLSRNERLSTAGFHEYALTEAATTPAPTPTPSPAPTRRPIIPRPSPVRVPCTIERRARNLC
jgi:hypothetical protein